MVVSLKTLRDEQLLSGFGAFTNYSAMLLSRYFGITGKALGMVLEGASASMTQIGLHMEYKNNQISLGQYKGESAANAFQAVATIVGFGREIVLENRGARIAYLHELYSNVEGKRPDLYVDSPDLDVSSHHKGMQTQNILYKIFGRGNYIASSSQQVEYQMTSMQYFHFQEMKDFNLEPSEPAEEYFKTVQNEREKYVEQKYLEDMRTNRSYSKINNSLKEIYSRSFFGNKYQNDYKDMLRILNDTRLNDDNSTRMLLREDFIRYEGASWLATQRQLQMGLVIGNVGGQTSQYISNAVIMNGTNKPSFY